ncbi:MAG: endonuclease III [Candidatus Sungbacteria bacterium RIFCSPLOWO2_02_FULL_51_17]|uniref:Endonuclease III n=1 Tax=Candidatus Sungbacteria bacterium RIFCSPHIGHO2_02_FULL_51_29 TaxID=1802273 RepID=A0A1G2KRZ3_9BACT|nr:MAG: endonuclease III [Candidatus Sungbacteria bacterium RIFCSPHIGHO2_01_FULL_51_22]OHA01179.1 MAG: endonuclease III [Candidatus Sungbacteria bacterium RIFCSPHIGHO2_02_FULL_51_29]OHA08037.1 MAG: endonuclease III [Candidatus Sungbacteria bacterium RIFCSPLOWO2_01_FULL_51_34]OHA11483.1 MAG: endonuclease III [Candidatus Sungbacteria bacterium RIFCSPLOWO2_02_FULL_51_17]
MESFLMRKKRGQKIVSLLTKAYSNAGMALKYRTNFQLLVAVILSAQCTDKKVNEVTAPIFKKYKTAADFSKLSQKRFEAMIRPTGFYRAKAKNILATARIVLHRYGGKVPDTMADMLTLKGVARKTANVVLGNAYGIIEGIAVDTHVARLSGRLGLSRNTDPVKIERDLMELLPKAEWFRTTYRFIEHGRAVCTAKDPRCDMCPLAKLCSSAFQFSRFQKNHTRA